MSTPNHKTLHVTPYGLELVHDEEVDYYFVRRRGGAAGAALLVIDAMERILLVKVPRRPVEKTMCELPRGGVEPGETSDQAAIREVLEETGVDIDPRMLTSLGSMHPDGGIMGMQLDLYAARLGVVIEQLRPDLNEVESAHMLSMAHVESQIARGKITDGITMSMLLRWKLLDHEYGPVRTLEIRDVDGNKVTEIRTEHPHRTFQDYCRNRISVGWGYRVL